MKLLVLTLCVAVAFAEIQSRDLLSALLDVHLTPNFDSLSADQRLLIVELVAAAEASSLKQYIDSVKFVNVLAILKELPADQTKRFEQYLIEHLKMEYGNMTTTSTTPTTTTTTTTTTTPKPQIVNVGSGPSALKRDDVQDKLENEIIHNPSFARMSQEYQQFILDLFNAAHAHHMSEFNRHHSLMSIQNLRMFGPRITKGVELSSSVSLREYHAETEKEIKNLKEKLTTLSCGY